MKKLSLLLATSCLATPALAKFPGGTGTTYYVGTTGCSDVGAGTSQTVPWCTVTKVNAATFVAGDSILFQGGASFSGGALQLFGTLASGHFSSTSLSPITVASYGIGRATFTRTGATACIQIKDLGGLIVHDINCTSTGNGLGTFLQIFNDQGVLPRYDFLMFYNMDSSGFNGVDLEAWNGSVNLNYGFSNVSFTNVAVHDFQQAGSVGFFSLGLRNDTMTNVFMNGVQVYNHAGDGIDMWNTTGGVIQKSAVHDGGGFSNSTSAIQINQVNGIIISKNEIYKQAAALDGFDACGIDVDGTSMNVTVSYNWIHDNAGCGISLFQGATGAPWAANTIAYNITQNNATGNTNVKAEITIGAASQNGMSGLTVIGNTFYTSIGAANANACVQFNAANITGVFANNTCSTTANPRAVDAATFNPTTLQMQGNDYFGSTKVRWNNVSYTTIALWRAAVATEETYRGVDTSLTSDPSLTAPGSGGTCFTSGTPAGPQPCPSAYLLQAGSPMLNAGQNLPVVFGVQTGGSDYFGSVVPAPSNGGFDVGAHQRTQ